MALIEIELLKPVFEATVGLVVRTGRAVPFPTLPPLGEDRLILTCDWQGDPLLEPGFPGFTPPPGTVLLRFSAVLTHASVAEIRVQPDTRGTSVSGVAWILATATLSQVVLTLAGFDAGSGPVPLAAPQPLGALPLPTPNGAGIVAAALVADGQTVTLRLATSAQDNPLQPPANRLPAFLAQPDAVSANWLLHVPAAFFVDMVLDPLIAGLSPPPDGTVIEEAPRASWIQHEGGAWGVSARAGLVKINACPGFFGDVDMSVEVTVSARFVENPASSRIDIGLTIELNASDWDSFRCWLGSAGIGSFGLGLINPYLGIAAAIASLTAVSEVLRHEVGDAAGSLSAGPFTKVSQTTSSVSYAGSVPIEPLPFSRDVAFALGPAGLDVRGTMTPISPSHATSFNPGHGPLVGGWTSKVNCSHRSMDHSFAYQDVLVADTLVLLEQPVRGVPIAVYPTSVAEPAGKCWIEMPNGQPNVPVRIKAPGMREGDAGFAVLHTSAGLRAYQLAPLPATPSQLPGTQRLIDSFCDTLHVPLRAIEIHELKWVEPPPDYNWGHDPLRQWQIVVQDLVEGAPIEIRANTNEGPVLATRADFTESARRAVIELVTDAQTELVLQAPNAGSDANVTLTMRWLLPQHREAFDTPVRGLSKTGSMLTLRTGDGERTFDLDQWKSGSAPRAAAGRTRVIDRQGQALTLKANQVALIHRGELVIATPVNALTRES